jgi:hypothetical protein
MIPRYESGALPLLAAPYVAHAFTVINVAAAGWSLYEIFGTDDPEEAAEGLAGEQTNAALLACHEANGTGEGLTPGTRAQYLAQLDNWEARGKTYLSGVKRASFLNAVGNVRGLISAATDNAGEPVTACHFLSGAQILDRMFTKIQAGQAMPPAIPGPEHSNGAQGGAGVPGAPGKPQLSKWIPLAVVGAGLAFLYLTQKGKT